MIRRLLLLIFCWIGSAGASDFKSWSPTPPMGWNSWDYFGTTVTEEDIKAQADAMAEHLLPAGYDILTVDIQWYEPNAQGHSYDPNAILSMDAFGRLQPAVNRFPSSAGGKGFKPLADYVHSKGLRFGIHIMRGIPKQAVKQNTPVLGSPGTAQSIADTQSFCPWNPDMFGVDATTPEGQAYYDSIFQMYADWGVDYIKVDDISRPYDGVQQAEIEAIRKAIDKTGRPMLLSLSPGATPVKAGPHVSEHANLWRISDDFWDRWGLLKEMFDFTHAWEPYRHPGTWPDADMLPIGKVDFGRPTNFTLDEQRTMMNLWALAKSPLIFGGDMTQLDAQTKETLTNPELLAVNQTSLNNRQLSRQDNLIVWVADVPNSPDKYVGLFNAQSPGDLLTVDEAKYVSPIISGKGRSQPIEVSIKGGKQLALYVTDAGDGIGWDHAVWNVPVLKGPKGELALTNIEWRFAEAGYGNVMVDQTCEGNPLSSYGDNYRGIGTHSNSKIIYDLPEGYDTFSTTGVMTMTGSVQFAVQVTLDDVGDMPPINTVTVNFADIGLSGDIEVKDLWSHQSLGVFNGMFSRQLRQHESGLYRLSSQKLH